MPLLLPTIKILVALLLIKAQVNCAGGAGAISIFSSNYLRRSGASTSNLNSPLLGSSFDLNSPSRLNNKLKVSQSSASANINANNAAAYLNNKDCPVECACQGLSIDCSNRGLKQVPKNIPLNVIKVYV